MRQQKFLHTCRRKRLRFSFARNNDGIFGVILSRFRSEKTKKHEKIANMKIFFKKGQKMRIFDDIYIVRFRTHFEKGVDCVCQPNKQQRRSARFAAEAVAKSSV